jgi:hypothetical protein
VSERLLKNALFCPIPASDSNFNPRNTQCIPMVKIIVFLGLGPRLNGKYKFNWAGKIKHFSKVSSGFIYTFYNPYLSPITYDL